MTIRAKFENGVFRPLREVAIEEGTVVDLHVPDPQPATHLRSIGESPFAGMWKDRTDIEDSVDYVNCIRRGVRR
ncbi:MAG: antitoxin family protein [Acidobacteria bacterium]|nr:antitoxin family protein [Acidobacteriota bacterium]